MKKYYYEVKFHDGRVIRREYQTKKISQAAYDTFLYEMTALGVQEISWGLMQ